MTESSHGADGSKRLAEIVTWAMGLYSICPIDRASWLITSAALLFLIPYKRWKEGLLDEKVDLSETIRDTPGGQNWKPKTIVGIGGSKR